MKHLTLWVLLCVCTTISYSQISVFETPVSINPTGSNSHSSAMLDIDSDNKGILIPRLTTNDINSISNPVMGLLVFDSDVAVFKYWDGSLWKPITSSSAGINGVGDILVTGSNGIYTVSYTDADKDSTNEVQFISKNGNVISLSAIEGIGGGTVTLDDNDPTNEIQNLIYNYASNRLTITGNSNTNVIDFSAIADQSEEVEGINDITVTEDNGVFTVDYQDGDKSDTNEAQAISKNGSNISLTMANGAGGGTVTLSDDDASNEIQDLAYTPATNVLNVTNNATATDIDLTELEESVVGTNDITVTESNGEYTVDYEDGDKSDTNEAQTISKNGADVTLTMANGAGGGTITLIDDSITNEIQDLTYTPATNVLNVTNNATATDIDLTELEESVVGTNDISVTESNGEYTVDYVDGDKSDINEVQTITKNNNEIELSDINGVDGGLVILNDDSSTNELQDLQYTAATNMLTVTNNSLAVPVDLTELEESVVGTNDITVTETNGEYTVDYVDGDKSDTNEAQTISKNGAAVTLTMANGAGGGTITLVDDSITNEIQDLTYTPATNVLKVTNNTSATDIDLTELEESVVGTNDITVTESNGEYTVDYMDGDKSNTNEAQTISKSGADITLTAANGSGGGTITLVDDSITNEIQDLEYNAMTYKLKVTNNTTATEIELVGLRDDLGNHQATKVVGLDDNRLNLKDTLDTKNALRYSGSTSMFDNYNPNGVAMYGEDGGVLGTTKSGENVVLTWSDENRVGINTTNPTEALDVDGNIALTKSTGDEMIIKNDDSWTNDNGAQDMSYGDQGGDHWMVASKDGSSQGSGIFGDGNHLTLWSKGEDIETPNAFMYFLDTDKMDSDGDPYDNNAILAYVKSTSGEWMQASDINRKENISPIRNSLDKILSLNGYSYDFKRTESEIARGMTAVHSVGVIAQEVAEVAPELVDVTDNGEHFVSYSEFIPLLIESIKAQQAQIDALTEQLEALKAAK